ncbi:MAG: hypothetical protein IJG13_14425, partial [Kiritimatiellae bacterium]|nr:hypothetical protein [Kiritimatiellia bacterium]
MLIAATKHHEILAIYPSESPFCHADRASHIPPHSDHVNYIIIMGKKCFSDYFRKKRNMKPHHKVARIRLSGMETHP